MVILESVRALNHLKFEYRCIITLAAIRPIYKIHTALAHGIFLFLDHNSTTMLGVLLLALLLLWFFGFRIVDDFEEAMC
jgi:hypothetical protein